jgi:hypothetical protein
MVLIKKPCAENRKGKEKSKRNTTAIIDMILNESGTVTYIHP